tara:strand:- start:20 stop:349 length:330 start_codon:yes stop_codon:yes gene_type:complete
MAEANDNTKNFIDQLSKGNNDEAGEAFKAALRDKVADQLDTARKDLAGNMFKVPTEAETFSDPKPEIADPGVFNADGSVSPTPTDAQAKDGKAEIDLTPEADNASKQDS